MKMKPITQILKEIKALNEKLSSDLEKKVGNVLFGENPAIAKLQKAPAKPIEPDTSWEDNTYSVIMSWMSNSDTVTAKYFAKNKELLQTLAKEFPTALRPPIGKTAYRGTNIKIDSLKKAFLKKQYTIVRVGGKEVFHFKNLDYNPNRDSQSWTIDPKVAFRFEGRADNQETVPVVYATKVNNDFIFSPELFRIMFDGVRNEEETIRVGSKGTFIAFVSSEVFLNTWRLDPVQNFIHKLAKAAPFFKPMVDKYNKLAAKDNKRFGEEMIPPVRSVDDIIKVADSGPEAFKFKMEYSLAVKQFIKSVKNK